VQGQLEATDLALFGLQLAAQLDQLAALCSDGLLQRSDVGERTSSVAMHIPAIAQFFLHFAATSAPFFARIQLLDLLDRLTLATVYHRSGFHRTTREGVRSRN